ncbi:Probable cation efflux system protein Rv2025c [Geodia barretti]|uniref:Probable cation efflux system protein Rv2025c n=1 Tax=Geodia barretti TaxID=519541 RepID=A0AA35WN22_GEOBA|nr:Probable cation efflux system protein Rv2025c [Geodia barretti]
MLEKENLDVVSVATPDDYHTNPVCDASDAGIKGILCEKPLTINLEDADRIIETVERNGTKMSVDHTRSWLPLYQAVRTSVREDPVWLIAAHEQGFEDYGIEYKGEGGHDPGLDPASSILIEFSNGVRGIVNSAKMTPAGCEFDLQGPNGRYVLNDSHCKAWKTDQPEGTATEAPAPQGETYGDFFGDSLIHPVRELAQMVGVVVISGSVALLADTIHNFGDAATAIPLWIAFSFARLKPSKRFTYGYGRVEDLAGIAIVLTILFSAIVAGYESSGKAVFTRLLDGVEDDVIDEINHAAYHVEGVRR